MPLVPAASALASRLLTVKVELPLISSVVLSASASAFTVIVSPLPLAVIVVLAVPVVILMASSDASPVVTVKVPVKAVALISPIRLLTTWLAAPLSVNVVLLASEVASMVRVSPLVVPLTVVAPLPVVIVAALSLTSV